MPGIFTVPFLSQTQNVLQGIFLRLTLPSREYSACSALSYLWMILGDITGLSDFSPIIHVQPLAKAFQLRLDSPK